jgi:uncharacterized protein YbcI
MADTQERSLSIEARVSNEIVRTMKELYGKGPTKAKTYMCDDNVFCVMKGGLTRNEETMIRGGQQELVRQFRLEFQRLIEPEIVRRVEDVLSQRVLSYHSQILFDPDRIIEMFVLEDREDPGNSGPVEPQPST